MGLLSGIISSLTNSNNSDEWVLGTDTSHWSGNIDFNKMANAGAKFWITKASDSNWKNEMFEDVRFDDYCRKLYANKVLLSGCYHWLQPGVDPIVAAKFYLQRYNRFDFDFPPVLDFEEPKVLQTRLYSDYAWRAEEWLRYVESETGRKPIIYTAQWYMGNFPEKYVSWMSSYPLWVAFYSKWYGETLRQIPDKYVPYPWVKPTVWQFSADGNRRGDEFGVDAGNIDLNWFMANYFQLLEFLEIENPIEPTPPIPPTPTPEPDYLFQAECVVGALNVRSGPSTSFNKRRIIREGDIVNVYDVRNNWYKISKNLEEWVAGYPQYMRKIEESTNVLFQARCVTYALNVRVGPSTSFPVKKVIYENDVVNVYDVQNNWFKISDSSDEWVSGYSQFMEKI